MNEAAKRIEAARTTLGPRLAILGHHYQSDEVIRHTDIQGDSLELARRGRDLSAAYIVFCGVYFMAESSAALAAPGQKVFTPAPDAACVMSDMAPAAVVQRVVTDLLAAGRRIVPLTYVNSSAAVKAVCGRHGGSVCTSANADRMMRWALDQGDGVLFLPDRNLAANTADKLGLPASERGVLDIRQGGARACASGVPSAQLLMWPGRCVIHHRFKADTIAKVRAANPAARIVVHPECSPAEVAAADATGSTSFIIRYVDEAPAGSVIYVGTESNLVWRLAKRYAGIKQVLPLRASLCANMGKVTEDGLADLLENIATAEPVRVAEDTAEGARLALERMLEVCR